jgi:hypothetical protein
MLNPLIDSDIINTEETKNEHDKNKSTEVTDDCSWCIFCDLSCLFMCCLT